MGRNLLIATRNQKKKLELREILSDLDVDLITLDDIPAMPEVSEDGETFAENAIKKALLAAAASGLTTLADDSGLVVDVLHGQPGIYSARFAGPGCDDKANNLKLLEMMAAVSPEGRTARFICVIAVAAPGGQVETVEGICEGTIIDTPRGLHGFGYDPLFVPEGYDQTFAELGEAEKNIISHRGRALQQAKPLVRRLLGAEGEA